MYIESSNSLEILFSKRARAYLGPAPLGEIFLAELLGEYIKVPAIEFASSSKKALERQEPETYILKGDIESGRTMARDGKMLVAGDFNVGFPIARDGRTRYAKQLARAWETLGLVSVYHWFFDVQMGEESRPTFFDERRRQQGWHIDYILMHRDQLHRVRNLELGDFWEWVASGRSDHVPLILDVDW